MAYWVHVEKKGALWRDSSSYDPPAPEVEGRKGYPVLCVESQGSVFRFSSREQVIEFLDVMSRKPLPTSRRLSARRGGNHGPNSHWLSRLPGGAKSPKARTRIVADVSDVVRAMPPEHSFRLP